jgi:hypothetical protein
MRRHPSHPASWLLALLVLAPLTGQRLTADEDGPPALPGLQQPEVLSRGSVHEAFAEPVNLQVQLGLVAPEPPPPNIAEVPPAERPQGQQFAWIPGYWSWDAARGGYIWVSACWRAAPPKMSWMPGYWLPAQSDWVWVPSHYVATPSVEPPGSSRREAPPPRPRQAEAPQAERVQIPPPPAAGRSGLQDIFRRGPPTRPADEGRDAAGRDLRKGKAPERDSHGGRMSVP